VVSGRSIDDDEELAVMPKADGAVRIDDVIAVLRCCCSGVAKADWVFIIKSLVLGRDRNVDCLLLLLLLMSLSDIIKGGGLGGGVVVASKLELRKNCCDSARCRTV
jgi:hypothetical protein